MKKVAIAMALFFALSAGAQSSKEPNSNEPEILAIIDAETGENVYYAGGSDELSASLETSLWPSPLWLYNLYNSLSNYHIRYWTSGGRLYWVVEHN